MKVLVLDAKQRSALAVTRSLGQAGLNITTADDSEQALAGCSRFSANYFQSPSSETAPKAYVAWLKRLISSEKFDMVLPVTEVTSQLLLMQEAELADVSLPFASYDTVMKLADKGHLVSLAEELGVPHPATQWYASAASLDMTTVNYPVVLKPCVSKIYTPTGWVSTRVRVLRSQADLQEELRRSTYLQHHAFMLQEFIPGKGAGIFCLYERGKPKAFFAHRRLREKPPEGGVSVLSESAPIDPQMQAYATTLLDGANWHGVAMVEFRVTPAGEPYLMEVNTRFWGSLQLAVDAGVDFPKLLWEVHQGGASAQPPTYRVGQRLRWLLGDLDSLYIYMKGPRKTSEKVRRLLAFFTPKFRHCRHEINRLNDLGPARYELKRYLEHLRGREVHYESRAEKSS